MLKHLAISNIWHVFSVALLPFANIYIRISIHTQTNLFFFNEFVLFQSNGVIFSFVVIFVDFNEKKIIQASNKNFFLHSPRKKTLSLNLFLFRLTESMNFNPVRNEHWIKWDLRNGSFASSALSQ